MNTEEWKKILDKLSGKVLTRRIAFCGGEPLMRRDLASVLAYAKEREFYTSVVTNGFLLNLEMMKCFEGARLDNLVISLNGTDADTHDSSRGVGGSYERIMKILPALKNYSIKTNLQTIIMGTNVDQLIPLAELTKKHHVYGIIYQVLADAKAHYPLVKKEMEKSEDDWYHNEPFWVKEPESVAAAIKALLDKQQQGCPILNSRTQLKAMIRYYVQPESIKDMACLSGVSNFLIDPCGDVRLCYGFEPVGNICRENTMAIWFSEKAREVRKKIKHCERMCRLLNNNF
jgi:MoaA/NifB/PqqE/SkfB family radical SAM enzyme